MKPIKISTWLPVFSGFYGTIWEADGEDRELQYINDVRKEKNLSPLSIDDVEWDYEGYKEIAVKGITDAIGLELEAQGYISGYALEKLKSPREYNFANDSIDVSFTLTRENVRAIRNYLETHSEAFTKYLKSRYTGYAGFIPFHSNDINDWLSDFDATVTHEHKLGSVLNFILLNENAISEMDIYEDLCGNGMYLTAKNYDSLMSQTGA